MDPPELPECPVCLQPFDGESIIPRVLACGHSTCQTCLTDLPKPPFPRTIRCPACTQLVTYPPQGPSALPKNIDLLRISSSLLQSNPDRLNSKPKTPTVSSPDFIPNFWSPEFYCNWKQWIVPRDTISVDTSVPTDESFLLGTVIDSEATSGPSSRCSMKIHQKVSLFKLGSFTHSNDNSFNYSNLTNAIWILFKLSDGALAELTLILTSSSIEHRICTGYGLWYNEENQHLYLVCERKQTNLSNVIVSDIQDDISSFAMIGMDLCETISRFHETQLVTACTSLSCFGIDNFGHLFIDLHEVFKVGFRIQNMITETVSFAENNNSKRLEMEMEMYTFPSPELLVEFVKKADIDFKSDKSTGGVDYSSDAWSIACILLLFLIGKSFGEETHNFLCSYIFTLINENGDDCEGLYNSWLDKVSILLDTKLGTTDYVLMKDLLHKCLCLDPGIRPDVTDIWKCMRELIIKKKFDVIGSLEVKLVNKTTSHCLLLGDLFYPLKKTDKVEKNGFKDGDLGVESGGVIEGICVNSIKCTDLKGHLDCISGLAIGGGFLFSSSFDKTVNVWSLQGLNHVHTFKGHEHKVMAIVFVKNREPPLCISADNGGEIFVWTVTAPFEENPFKRLNEEKDWRYSGIHSLAVSESAGYFYTGSGDKSIKAWSMHDYSLSCSMTGHKSVVSTLAVCKEVLYSGSWDGTIRLWCLSDHTPLAVLGGEEGSGTSSPFGSILSLAVDTHTLVAAHENGCIKIWKKDVPLNPVSAHTSSIFSICMEGEWIFSGGWNKTVIVQRLSGDESGVDVTQIGSIGGDSVVTALVYWQGKLFVGQADRIIKVYSFGG